MNLLIHRTVPHSVARRFEEDFARHAVRFVAPSESIEPHLAWAQAVLGNPSPESIIEQASGLEWLQLLSSGIDGYERLAGACFKVTTAHGVHAPIIAEHCLTMMLMFERRMSFFTRMQLDRNWNRQPRIQGSLRGKTLGLVGFGSIATELTRLAQPFGMNVIAVTKNPDKKEANRDVEMWPIEEIDTLLEDSDHIVVTLPLTKETRNFLSAEKIAMIKPNSFFYNVGRGDLLDQDALQERLVDGSLGGAALDVFSTEPLPSDSPLWSLPNCIVTPHIAGHYRDLDIDILKLFAENLRRLERSEPLENLANFERGY